MGKELVFGVGLNDANYVVGTGKRTYKVKCPYYARWVLVLERCYSEKSLAKRPTYAGCYVCDEWLTFSNFKLWMEKQDWKGKELDKDILVKGNKVYSPETCVFISQDLNAFTNECGNARGEYLTGAHKHKASGRIQAMCCNPFTKKQEYLGLFDDEISAHMAWKSKKHQHACALADQQVDLRISKSLRERYL